MPLALLLPLLSQALSADTFEGYTFHYGEPHAHTGISHDGESSDLLDGCAVEGDCGPFETVFDTAVANGLDWVVLSEHVNGGNRYAATEAEFLQLVRKNVDDGPSAGLLVIPGAEVWFYADDLPLGHRNLLLFGDLAGMTTLTRADVLPTDDPDFQLESCDDIDTWMEGLVGRFGDAMLVPHHTIVEGPMPNNWNCHSSYEPAVEVYSGWGTSLGWGIDYDTPEAIVASGAVHIAMDPEGLALRMGFLAGTDEHMSWPGDLCQTKGFSRVSNGGITMAVLPEGEALTSASLYSAIVERRTLATTGPRVPMVATYSTLEGDAWGLGEELTLVPSQTLTLGLDIDPSHTYGVVGVWLVTPDGEVEIPQTAVDTWSTEIAAVDAPAWAYLAVQFDAGALGLCDDGNASDDEWIWLSPSWIEVVDRDEDGVTTADGDCDDADATVFPGQTEQPDDGVDSDCDGYDLCFLDSDGDGHPSAETGLTETCWDVGFASGLLALDCDDGDATISPSIAEISADGVDQDCDGVELCYANADNDAYRSDDLVEGIDCTASGEALAVQANGDCNDSDAATYPGATEEIGDERDQDCDGGELCRADRDLDGYRTDEVLASDDADCVDTGEAPESAPPADCADANAAFHPDAPEPDCTDPNDYNCDGLTLYADDDADGWAVCEECDDTDADVRPDAEEITGDGIDQDCDGVEPCFVDADDDGYVPSDPAVMVGTVGCTEAGEATGTAPGGDCDDVDASEHPGAAEVTADGVDQDCDGFELCYVDGDTDGYLRDDPPTTLSADIRCQGPGEALAGREGGDCDDADAAIHPDAEETDCTDPVDYNCDGVTLYTDGDLDGFAACVDCADSDPSVFPGASEGTGDGVDQDCDGTEICFQDADSDGYLVDDPETVLSTDLRCTGPGEALAGREGGDCDDADAAIHPDAEETDCTDPVDYNCDGLTLYTDGDLDGFAGCIDCADSDPSVFPGAEEGTGDGVDQDCDGTEICYVDADSDGYLVDDPDTVPSMDLRCAGPGEALAGREGGDCDDSDGAIHPDAEEPDCTDPVDYNCDGSTGFADLDADGFPACVECRDDDPAVNPAATERPGDELDQNCDGGESCFLDSDGDGYRTEAVAPSVDLDCDDVGEASGADPAGDCDDLLAVVHPGAEERPGDEVDADCDGGEICFVDADDDGYRVDNETTVVSDDVDCDDAGEWAEGEAGHDCDDTDPSVALCETASVESAALDSEDTGSPQPACGCGTGAPSGGLAGLVLLALGLRRRLG